MERIRIGLVGAGLIGATHSLVLQEIAAAWPERVELTAVADPLAENRERFVRQAFGDAAALLAGRDPSPGLDVGVEAQRLAAAVYAAARDANEIDVAGFGRGGASRS